MKKNYKHTKIKIDRYSLLFDEAVNDNEHKIAKLCAIE